MALAALAFITQLAFVLFPGLVLHRALAGLVLKLDSAKPGEEIDEVDLLGFGLLPGLALANTFGTILAIFKVFYWWSYLVFAAIVIALCWRAAWMTILAIGELAKRLFGSVLGGNFMIFVAVAILLQTAAGMLVEALLPSGGVDIWNHNYPLARSIVDSHGFKMPQIGGMFYGSYPIFYHMFFAEGLLFVDDIVAAKIANAIIYLTFLLSLLPFIRHLRALIVLLMSYLIIETPFFSLGTADVMTDTTRVCFSALAFVFAYQYFRAGRVYFLFASGLLAGGAIAGKYTELLTPVLIGLALLPALMGRRREAWLAVVVFSAATIVTGSYPYLRNLILLKNPIYPFFFGHEGIPDDYMAGLQAEVFHALDPTVRAYSQNLLSIAGWQDFWSAAQKVFLSAWKLNRWFLLIPIIGLLLLRKRAMAYFALWTLGMWIFWYTIGNVNYRWGLTAMMLLSVMGILVIGELIDLCAREIEASGNRWNLSYVGGPAAIQSPAWLTPTAVTRILVAVLAIYIGAIATQRVRVWGLHEAFPKWLNTELTKAVVQPGGIDKYLSRYLLGYDVYRYIGQNDLKVVLQPFDVGAYYFPSAYNGGRKVGAVLPFSQLPKDPSEYDQFIRTNGIRYYISSTISPELADRLNQGTTNPRHTETAYDLMRYLQPGSRLLLADQHGWELREIAPEKLK